MKFSSKHTVKTLIFHVVTLSSHLEKQAKKYTLEKTKNIYTFLMCAHCSSVIPSGRIFILERKSCIFSLLSRARFFSLVSSWVNTPTISATTTQLHSVYYAVVEQKIQHIFSGTSNATPPKSSFLHIYGYIFLLLQEGFWSSSSTAAVLLLVERKHTGKSESVMKVTLMQKHPTLFTKPDTRARNPVKNV